MLFYHLVLLLDFLILLMLRTDTLPALLDLGTHSLQSERSVWIPSCRWFYYSSEVLRGCLHDLFKLLDRAHIQTQVGGILIFGHVSYFHRRGDLFLLSLLVAAASHNPHVSQR